MSANVSQQPKQRPKTKRQRKGKKKGTSKKQLVVKEQPKVITVKAQSKGYRMPKAQINKTLQMYGSKLSSKEYAQAKRFIMNLLDPMTAYKLPRPVPINSVAILQSGELIFNSTSDYVDITMIGDPTNFLKVKKTSPDGHIINLGPSTNITTNWAALAPQSRYTILGNSTKYFSIQDPLPCTDGSYITPQFNHEIDSQSHIIYRSGNPTDGGAGYLNLQPTDQWGVQFVNKSQYTIAVTAGWQLILADEQITTFQGGTTANVAANSAAIVVGPILATAPPLQPGALFSFVIKIVPTQNINIDDIEYTINQIKATTTATESTTVYTLGEACYGKDNPDAILFDEIITGCQLWSATSASATYNMDMSANEAQATFLTAYLPSFIQQTLPQEYAAQWQWIEARNHSFPVKKSNMRTNGAQGTWIGGRFQDFELRQPIYSNFNNWQKNNLPIVKFLSKKANEDASATHRFKFSINLELVTTHPAFTLSVGPFHASFVGFIAGLLASHQLLVGENPSHVQRFKELTKQVLGNPQVQHIFKELLMAGATAGLPLLLA